MNHSTIAVRFILTMSSLSLVLLLLVGSLIGNASILASEKTNNNALSNTANHNVLNLGAPQKVTIPLDSQQHPTILSDSKKQQLMDANHRSPLLPSSGQPILGPVPGSQISP